MPRQTHLGQWFVTHRPYTGYEDSAVTPGTRLITTAYGTVLMIPQFDVLHATLALSDGGGIYRGHCALKQPVTPQTWKAETRRFIAAIRRHLNKTQ